MREVKGTKIKMPRQNFMDRLVSYVDPVRGAQRLRARAAISMAESYTGASRTRRQTKNWLAGREDADAAAVYDRDTLIDRSRDLVRNNPLATGAINTACNYAIGSGLSLHSKIDAEYLGLTPEEAEAAETDLERLWMLWSESKDCDIARSMSFKEQQNHVLRSMLEGGDCFVLLPSKRTTGNPFSLRTQILESERVSNPNWTSDTATLVGGVEKDINGAPVAYHFTDRHPGGYHVAGVTWNRVPAFGASGRPNVLHIHEKLRPGQTRGLPFLAPVIESLKMLSELSDAELMAAVVTSFLTVFVETPTGDAQTSPLATTESVSGSGKRDELGLGYGSIVDLADGEKIETVAPNRPNAAFDPFFLAICRQIGVALEIPFEILVGHFTASFSASQAAILSAWRAFLRRRVMIARNFCQPVYALFVDEMVSAGYFRAPGYFADPMIRQAYLGAEWAGEGRGSIDPLKEARANQILVAEGVKSRKRWATDVHGEDWEKTAHQLAKEKRLIDRLGIGPESPEDAAHEAAETDEEEALEELENDPDQLDNEDADEA